MAVGTGQPTWCLSAGAEVAFGSESKGTGGAQSHADCSSTKGKSTGTRFGVRSTPQLLPGPSGRAWIRFQWAGGGTCLFRHYPSRGLCRND